MTATPEQEADLRKNESLVLRDQLRTMPVTMENLDAVAQILAQVKQRRDALETHLKSITKPMRDAEKRIRDLFRPAIGALLEAENDLKVRIQTTRNAQFAVNQKAMAEAQAKLAQGDARGSALAAHVIASTALPTGLSERKRWTYRIVDDAQVPRELCSPDPAKIAAYVKAHENRHAVPGVEIFEESILASRIG